jgi:nucleotide-binding universal stress UspA family protein
VLVNEPVDGLIAASAHVDLLVMGSRARGAHKSVLLGSVSRKVADGAACPLVIIPKGASFQTAALLGDVAAEANKLSAG